MKPSIQFALVCCLLVFSYTQSKAQQYKWFRGGGTNQNLSTEPHDEGSRHMCTDYNGNVYSLNVVGTNAIRADTFYRSGAYGQYQNILLTSHDCNGQMRWAKLIAGTYFNCYSYGIVADNSGHVYVASFVSNGTLHVGYDTSITGSIYQRQALIQFDTSGEFNWIRYVGDNTMATYAGAFSYGSFVEIDGANNPHFFVSMRFGVPITSSITSYRGTYDLKYDQSGNLLGVKRFNLDSTLDISGAALDKQSGKSYLFGNRNLAFPGGRHPFIAAFDTSRNLIWKDTVRSLTSTTSGGFTGIDIDGTGHLYLSGGGNGSVVYRNDTSEIGSGYIAFVMKTDTSGNVGWLRTYKGTTSINALAGLTLMPNGRVAACGLMTGWIKAGADSVLSYAGEGQNAYFSVLDTNGNVRTLQQVHGNGFYDIANVVASDRIGNLYIGGQVEDSIWNGTIHGYQSVGGNTDFFIIKYGVDCSCTGMAVANFTAVGTSSISATYTGTTTALDSVVWDFGDGGRATGLTTLHTYAISDTYRVCATVYTQCGNDRVCQDMIITIPSLVSPSFPGNSNLQVFPNPAREELFINGLCAPATYRLSGITGATLSSGTITPSANTITLKNQPPAMYLLELTTADGMRQVARVVKE